MRGSPIRVDDRPALSPPAQVALLSMPTLAPEFPSFQLGLLKPTLEREGIDVQTFSMFLYFGAHIGWRLNGALSSVRSCMAGEWIWSKAAFGDFAEEEPYLQYYERDFRQVCRASGATLDQVLEVRNRKTFEFLDYMAERVDWSRFTLIGFSVVFQQMVASLAFARILKERFPQIPIAFGGATFEDDIADGIVRGCPWVDYVHCGDADETFPELVRRINDRESVEGLSGVMWRREGEVQFAGRAPNLANLNRTPIPEYEEYFYARNQSGYDSFTEAKKPMLPIETARGCWWGMKHHCTFCGLNRAGMEFRAKGVDQVLGMLQTLSRKYGILHFDAIDNIMETSYVDGLFGRLADAHSDVRIHYEVRPYFSRKKLKRLKQGGLFSVQPGIESFATNMLKLMKKNSTGVQNLAFLKWCTYYGINNLYNILLGFPGETREDYELQSSVIDRIPHLQPPWGIARARADRGSPMFTDPERHSITRLQPSKCYQFIYPSHSFDLERVSYFFEHDQDDVLQEKEYGEIYSRVLRWQERWKNGHKPSLKYSKSWNTIVIEDRRNGAAQRTTYVDHAAALYEFCNEPRTLSAITDDSDQDQDWLTATLGEFVQRGFTIFMDERYLSIALPANPNL